MKPARSIASLTPIASNSLAQLGGIDTASPRPGDGRVIRRTGWPHAASKDRRGGARRPAAEHDDYFFCSTSAMKARASRITSSVIPMCPLSV